MFQPALEARDLVERKGRRHDPDPEVRRSPIRANDSRVFRARPPGREVRSAFDGLVHEECQQIGVGLVRPPASSPSIEGHFTATYQTKSFFSGERLAEVVVSLMASLLKLDEDVRDDTQVGRGLDTPRCSYPGLRKSTRGIRLRDSLHFCVTECPPERVAASLTLTSSARNDSVTSLVHEKVEECVVSCGDRPSQACLLGSSRLSLAEVPCLVKEPDVVAHQYATASGATSDSNCIRM